MLTAAAMGKAWCTWTTHHLPVEEREFHECARATTSSLLKCRLSFGSFIAVENNRILCIFLLWGYKSRIRMSVYVPCMTQGIPLSTAGNSFLHGVQALPENQRTTLFVPQEVIEFCREEQNKGSFGLCGCKYCSACEMRRPLPRVSDRCRHHFACEMRHISSLCE